MRKARRLDSNVYRAAVTFNPIRMISLHLDPILLWKRNLNVPSVRRLSNEFDLRILPTRAEMSILLTSNRERSPDRGLTARPDVLNPITKS